LNVEISKHTKDLIQKHTAALLREIMPEFYGIKIGRVKELINPELPEIKVGGGGTDMIFLTDDDKYLHLGFETGIDKDDIRKHLSYDARLIQRDGREVVTVIVYTADVKEAPAGINGETLVYNPHIILMNDYDGNAIYVALKAKINAGQPLDDKDILNLLFLPLMRNTIPRGELAESSMAMANTILDRAKREACIVATYAFASKYLNEAERKKLLEVLKMCDLLERYVTDTLEERFEEKLSKVAKRMLRNKCAVEFVALNMEVDIATVQRWKDELDSE
jgi:hypothetical protein